MEKFSIHEHENALSNFHCLFVKDISRAVTPHFHDYYQMHFVPAGELFQVRNGLEERLCAGEAVLMPPLMEHHVVPDRPWVPYYAVSFQPSFLPREVMDGMLGEYLQMKRGDLLIRREKIVFSGGESMQVARLIEMMLRELENGRLSYATTLQGLIIALIGCAMRAEWQDSGMSVSNEGIEERRRRILEFVEEMRLAPERQVSVEEAAHGLAMSRAQFCKAFLEVTGTSYAKYRNHLRVDYAARLLHERRYSLDYIAETCGFREYSSFYRNFVALIGIAPADYRKLRIDRRDPKDE
ncbi:MAG: AraC family transcriptional regulator [Clostridia bacterium]|nr:AraC family transcriptional regulator [Clostridia bacterium]